MDAKQSYKRRSLALEPTEHQGQAKRPAIQTANRARALSALKSTYGFDEFRGRQEDAVLAALSGRDVLVIMPTGGGKTICYVIPALVQPGVCIVVSPLLALMQDQVANLTKVGVNAAQLSSTLPAAQRSAVLADLERGGSGGGGAQPNIRILLVTPELLATSERFQSVLRRLHSARNLSLFAIDESHCISTWGHDFRPAYRRLQALRRNFPGVPIMALTATAASQVQDDICQQLRLSNPVRLLSSFNRPNISYTVRYLDAEAIDEVEALLQLLARRKEAAGVVVPCSIVYCQKRDTCDSVASRLRERGFPAAAYHGQMKEADKKEVLRRWQADEVPVVVATIAFGMGIDKAGVRLVVHFNLPRCLEGFYQEAGRAGRDGLPAESVLFYSREARKRMDYILEQDKKRKDAKLAEQGSDAQEGGKSVQRGGGGWAGSRPEGEDEEVAAAAAASVTADEQAQVQATAWQAFGRVVDWATAASCRRRALLAHFGERAPAGPCSGTGDGHVAGCDYCRDPAHVGAQLEVLRKKELDAAAKGRGGGQVGGGDEEADMFAVRGGGGGEGGESREGEEAEAGPTVYHAGRKSPESEAAAAEARSAAAAARAAAGGQVNHKYFAALEAREKEHERRLREGAGDIVDRMMASSCGGGGGGRGGTSSASAPPPNDAARCNATAKLAAALGGNAAAAGFDLMLLQRLAEAVEADVYGSGLPRQQYTSRMAGLLSRAKAAASPLVMLPQAPAATATSSSTKSATPPQAAQPPATPSAAAASLLPALLQGEVAAIQSLLASNGADASGPAAGSHGAGAPATGAIHGGSTPTAQVAARLSALASVAVTVEAVVAGDVGKRVARLGKHPDPRVAEAARQVVDSWKRQIPEGPKRRPQ